MSLVKTTFIFGPLITFASIFVRNNALLTLKVYSVSPLPLERKNFTISKKKEIKFKKKISRLRENDIASSITMQNGAPSPSGSQAPHQSKRIKKIQCDHSNCTSVLNPRIITDNKWYLWVWDELRTANIPKVEQLCDLIKNTQVDSYISVLATKRFANFSDKSISLINRYFNVNQVGSRMHEQNPSMFRAFQTKNPGHFWLYRNPTKPAESVDPLINYVLPQVHLEFACLIMYRK